MSFYKPVCTFFNKHRNLGSLRWARIALLCIGFLFVFAGNASATHLVGGSITYRYVGQFNGLYRFEVSIDMFRDGSQRPPPLQNTPPTPFDQTIDIGVYSRPDSIYITHLVLTLISDKQVQPPAATEACKNTLPKTYIYESNYAKGFIDLKPSDNGYLLAHLRCCRNTMLNLKDNMGQTYLAIIPPTNTLNTTPVFNTVPSPYIGQNDTVSLNYSATEPDGDSLSYSLGDPYSGGDTAVPIPVAGPGNKLSLINVDYNNGYSPGFPFSHSGFVKIDPITGLLTMKAPLVGRYAIAVDVSEYRNGKLISVTRRDVQIITVSIPYHPPPHRTAINDSIPADNSTANTYIVEAGYRLSFNLLYQADSTIAGFYPSGFVVNPGNVGHKPFFTSSIDKKTAKAYFNWQTTCKDASPSPYTFTMTVTDFNCPQKTLYDGIKIFVVPFKGATHINGPNPACQGNISYYTTNVQKKGYKITWYVTGGIYTKGNNDSTIKVVWNKAGSGTIRIIGYNTVTGCIGDTVIKNIIINPKPKPPVVSGPATACVGNMSTYTVKSFSDLNYTWVVTGGSLNGYPAPPNKTVRVGWYRADTNTIKAIGIDSNGCPSDTTVLRPIVEKPIADSIYGSYSVCPNSSGVDYWVKPQKGSTYFWKISGGTQVSGGNTFHIKIDWGEKGGGWIKVKETTLHGCPGDTILLNVTKDYVLYTSPILGDTSLCEFTRGKVYQVSYSNGSLYAWKISGGTIVAGNGTASVVVDWDKAGHGALIVQETAYDPINHKPCTGIPVSAVIHINPLPNTSEIIGPAGICENDIVIYSVHGLPGSTYIWKFHGKTNLSHADTARWQETSLNSLTDTIHIEVTELSIDSCPGQTRYLVVTAHKVPVTSEITGLSLICFPNLAGAAYSVKGFATSTYLWTVDGGAIVKGDKTQNIIVDWYVEGNRAVHVQEISDFGCKGPEKSLAVRVDSLAMDIDLVTTNQANDKEIDVYWTKKNAEFFKGYFRVYRSVAGQEFYRMIDSVPATQTYYVDKNVNTAMYAYRYRIEAVNSCGYRIETHIHRTINLGDKFDGDTTIQLHWNKYEGWPVDVYNVNHSSDNDTGMSFYNFTKDTSFAVIKTLDGYRLCMRIAAFKAGSGLKNVVSWSNKVCVDFDPLVWIPNVFTPANGDNLNNTFHIFAGNYKAYQLEIYNRWGEHIYSSNDPAKQWDGTYKGNLCVEGVYLYMVTINGARSNLYRTGTVNLLR
jgi:gliding motility-associated-like protein